MDEQIKEKEEDMVEVVIFTLDNEEYAVSVFDVREVIEIPDITPVPNSPEFVLGLINLRGKIISVINLEEKFNLKRDGAEVSANIVVIDSDGRLFGVVVDNVVGVRRISKKHIQNTPDTVYNKIDKKYVKGTVVITEGDEDETTERILLLLDIKNILTEGEKKEVHNIAKTENKNEVIS